MFSVRVERKNRKDYDAAVGRARDRWLPLAGAAVEGQAKLLAPVDTGNLRASITNYAGTDRDSRLVGTNVDYAQHIEYGTRFLSRQSVKGYSGYKPFLRPAIDLMRKKLTELFRKMVREEVARGRA